MSTSNNTVDVPPPHDNASLSVARGDESAQPQAAPSDGQNVNDRQNDLELENAELKRKLDAELKGKLDGQTNLKNVFLLAVLGWTPLLWNYVKDSNPLMASVYFFLFVVDFADAVFDVVLGVQVIYSGSEGKGGLGILLLVMTILGRILSGVYGLAMAKNPSQVSFGSYAMMEMGVFFWRTEPPSLCLQRVWAVRVLSKF